MSAEGPVSRSWGYHCPARVNAAPGVRDVGGFALDAVHGRRVREVQVRGGVVGVDNAFVAGVARSARREGAVAVDRRDGPDGAVLDPVVAVVLAGLDGVADVDGLLVLPVRGAARADGDLAASDAFGLDGFVDSLRGLVRPIDQGDALAAAGGVKYFSTIRSRTACSFATIDTCPPAMSSSAISGAVMAVAVPSRRVRSA